jgi:hypothetical protein
MEKVPFVILCVLIFVAHLTHVCFCIAKHWIMELMGIDQYAICHPHLQYLSPLTHLENLLATYYMNCMPVNGRGDC